MVKAIFFDIDGTLVSFKTHRVPDSTIEAIRLAKAAGRLIFISTGRPVQVIDNVGAIESMIDGYVTTNGAHCFSGDRLLLKKTIPMEDAEKMWKFSEKMGFSAMFIGQKNIYVANKDEKMSVIIGNLLNLPAMQDCAGFSEMSGDEIFQISPVVDTAQEAEIMPRLPGCDSCRWSPVFMDVIPKGVDKAKGIAAVAAHFGFGMDECMSFGDGGNDIAMLKAVGTGIAMGNSSEEVKAAADYVTASVDEDGIYQGMKYYGII